MAQRGSSSRGNPALGDILRSVFVMGAILLGIWAFGQLLTYTPEHPVREVDHLEAASAVEAQTGFEPLVPTPLPQDWRPTSARFDTTTWNLGIVTPDEEFVGLIQSTDPIDTVIKDFAGEAKETGTVTIDGVEWRQFAGPGEDITVGRTEGEQAIVVTASVGRDRLEAYVRSLEPLAQP